MSRPLAVLHVAQPLDAGVPRIVADLALDQVARGWQVHVAAPDESQTHELVRGSGVESHTWTATRSPGPRVPSEARVLNRIISSARPDLIHLHSAKAGLVGRLALRGRLPTVFEPNAWSFEALEGPIRALAMAWERFAAKWTDALVCVSTRERATGEAAGISAPYEVVPNGIDLSTWTARTPHDRAAARERLGIDPNVDLCVCVGRLSRQKGQDVLLDAWPQVTGTVPGAELVLIGDGPERRALEDRALAGVHLVGTRRDVRDWFLASNVVAMPSRWEGMSLGMLEAMATGCSIVATDVAGAAEALSGGAGEVVPVGDAGALAAALIGRLRDPGRAAAEGAAARRLIEANHDVRVAADRIASIYRTVLARRS